MKRFSAVNNKNTDTCVNGDIPNVDGDELLIHYH